MSLLGELGFTFNEKLQPPAQLGEFIGMGWDTLWCTFWMSATKANKVATAAAEMSAAGVASRSELAKLRGKLVWFSSCLHAVRLLTRATNAFVGSPTTDAAWDLREALPEAVLLELRHWATTLPTHWQADHERPFWRCDRDGCQHPRVGVHAQGTRARRVAHAQDGRAVEVGQA
eukprot:3265130-Rhodomonas_salina.1